VFIYITTGVVVFMAIGGLFYNRTRRLNALLNEANASLQETNNVKDKLFSVLAHDLRSPFVTIISLLSLINDDDDMPAADRKELIDMVSVTSTASLDILTNLLKWGEMQIKGIRLNTIDLNPTELIERNIAMLSATAGIKGIRLINLVDPDILVMSDRDHFEFILRNLLSNAIKFTNEGGEVIVTSQINHSENEARFIVADNGVGIEPEKAAQIFEISNISSNGTKEEKGTSLGLLLCKEFIEANKGKIWVESEVGVGSKFIFSLKLSSIKSNKKPSEPNLNRTLSHSS
jgi:signal transduction histidine kinase